MRIKKWADGLAAMIHNLDRLEDLCFHLLKFLAPKCQSYLFEESKRPCGPKPHGEHPVKPDMKRLRGESFVILQKAISSFDLQPYVGQLLLLLSAHILDKGDIFEDIPIHSPNFCRVSWHIKSGVFPVATGAKRHPKLRPIKHPISRSSSRPSWSNQWTRWRSPRPTIRPTDPAKRAGPHHLSLENKAHPKEAPARQLG